MKNHADRRRFLSQSAAMGSSLAAPTILSASVLGREGRVPPSDQVTLGVIGMGRRCTYDLTSMLNLKDVRCIAIADVQQSRRANGKKLVDQKYDNTNCQLYSDFRQLLDRKDIDAVLIATGDRWHAPASMLAAEAGKDVYSEKPCGLTIELCQKLDDTFKRTKRIFQAGTQRRSVPNFRTAVKMAQDGSLGRLKTLYASAYTPTLRSEWLPAKPTPATDVCDWNLWLGPAPWRPFNPKYVSGDWRGYWDFDSGARLLDWGAHTVDLCQWANQADDTTPVQFESSEKGITCRYANGVTLFIDFLPDPFGKRHPHYVTRLGTCPVRFEGTKGSVETGDSGEIVFKPESLAEGIAQTRRVRGLDVSEHARNFFDCVKSREQTVCNSAVMRRSHIACHAAALSWILQRKLIFNPLKEEFINDREANRLRSRETRDWT